MAVTYRAITRYSRRDHVEPSPSASHSSFAASLRPKLLLELVGRLVSQRWWNTLVRFQPVLLTTNFLWSHFFLTVTELTAWMLGRLLLWYYCAQQDENHKDEKVASVTLNGGYSSCWSVSVYLTDSCENVTDLRHRILAGAAGESALKLRRESHFWGWIHLWYTSRNNSDQHLFSVQVLPAVWNHRLVTEDTVQDYVSEVCNRSLLDEIWLWRLFLIPLDCKDVHCQPSFSNCCIVSQCHKKLETAVDSLVRHVLNWNNIEGSPVLFVMPRLTVERETVEERDTETPAFLAWTRRFPKDLLDRICLSAHASCTQIMLTVFCQSVNHLCQQIGSSTIIRVIGKMKEFEDSWTETTLSLGSSALEDGLLLLRVVQQQEEEDRAAAGQRRWMTMDSGPDCWPKSYRSLDVRLHDDGNCWLVGDQSRVAHSKTKANSSCSPILVVTMETIGDNDRDENGYGLHPVGNASLLHWSSHPTTSIPIRLSLWISDSTVRLGANYALKDHYRRGLFRMAIKEQVERRIYQLAASLGVQTSKPLSPHSTPGATPIRRYSSSSNTPPLLYEDHL